MRWTATQPALTTPWRVGPGLSHAGSTPDVMFILRRCYKTAWSWLQVDFAAIPRMKPRPRAPNCTNRQAGPGLAQAVSPPHALITRRRCYKTAWSLLQAELTMSLISRAPNSTTRQAGLGLTQAVSPPHELFTRRRCYKTAWSSLQGD